MRFFAPVAMGGGGGGADATYGIEVSGQRAGLCPPHISPILRSAAGAALGLTTEARICHGNARDYAQVLAMARPQRCQHMQLRTAQASTNLFAPIPARRHHR